MIKCKRVCIAMKPGNIGGPSAFVRKLTVGLERRGIAVTYSLADRPYDVVLVINATRELGALWRCKREGIRIVQRLGVPNYLHKLRLHKWNPTHNVRGEFQNLIMRLIKSKLADEIVYQSDYVKHFWEASFGVSSVRSTVIHNGVDLALFSPDGDKYLTLAEKCIISVEGTQGVDPFDIVVNATLGIGELTSVELLVLGNILDSFHAPSTPDAFINCVGTVPNAQLPYYYRGADLYIFSDIFTGGCPNSVIEALACGVPVIGYDVGVLPEMIDSASGKCAHYGADPWHKEEPKSPNALISAAFDIFQEPKKYRSGARVLAEKRYGLDRMVDAYIAVLLA